MAFFRRTAARIAAWSAEQSTGIMFTLGLASLAAGAALIHPPLGLIVPGAIIVSLTTVMHLIAFCRGG